MIVTLFNIKFLSTKLRIWRTGLFLKVSIISEIIWSKNSKGISWLNWYGQSFCLPICLQWPLPREVTPLDEPVECGDASPTGKGCCNVHCKDDFVSMKFMVIQQKCNIDKVFEAHYQCYSCCDDHEFPPHKV